MTLTRDMSRTVRLLRSTYTERGLVCPKCDCPVELVPHETQLPNYECVQGGDGDWTCGWSGESLGELAVVP